MLSITVVCTCLMPRVGPFNQCLPEFEYMFNTVGMGWGGEDSVLYCYPLIRKYLVTGDWSQSNPGVANSIPAWPHNFWYGHSHISAYSKMAFVCCTGDRICIDWLQYLVTKYFSYNPF